MEPERWREIERLYHAALGRPESERQAFLEHNCGGDEPLRRQVESLLAGETQAENFLESPAVAIAAKALVEDQAPPGPSSEAAVSMVGKTLGHYRILEKIGAGGMGVVYRARDERLDRDVALKVLPGGTLADEASRKRFRREALSLSKLNHPNIETVHDFDTQQGVDFLVMEYIAGESLDVKVASGPLPENETVRLALQLAEGLAAAHEQGVVHRDLKPGNLRVTPDGRLKILDFGLAKLISPKPAGEAATTESLAETQAGTIAGTLPYMSPEQLRSEKVGARTDIYAVGVLLYEMATGRRPFLERQTPRLIDAILHQAPQSPCVLNQRVSPGLEGFILKCLEKDPNLRYQTAGELRTDLERLSAGSSVAAVRQRRARLRWPLAVIGGLLALLVGIMGLNVRGLRDQLLTAVGARRAVSLPRIESIAVLPLENLSHDPDQEYFADGMTEELITELAKMRALRVVSRTSVMQYKGMRKPLSQIAKELNVDGVLVGSVQRSGHEVLVTAHLIRAATGRHLWAQSYERNLREVLELEGDLAQAIAREIRVALSPEEETRLASARPVSPEAHEAYLKGRYYWNKRTEDGAKKSLSYFRQAIEDDPTYAQAYSGLADSYVALTGYGKPPPNEVLALAKAAATKALELDDKLAEAHSSLALTRDYEWDWAGAEREHRRAIELNPGYATAHHWYATHLARMGRLAEAVAESKRAQELDPLSPILSANLAHMSLCAGQYTQDFEALRKLSELDPDFPWLHHQLGRWYEEQGRYEEAIAEHRKALSLSEGHPYIMAGLGHTYAVAGEKAEALKVLSDLKELSERRYVSPVYVSVVYAGLGDMDDALVWLQKAYEERDLFPMIWLKVDPYFNALRSDPRFQELLRRAGLPP
jgi:eukaryotic-like serine/threonine-protein kinase